VLATLGAQLLPPLAAVTKTLGTVFGQLSPVLTTALQQLGTQGLTPILTGLTTIISQLVTQYAASSSPCSSSCCRSSGTDPRRAPVGAEHRADPGGGRPADPPADAAGLFQLITQVAARDPSADPGDRGTLVITPVTSQRNAVVRSAITGISGRIAGSTWVDELDSQQHQLGDQRATATRICPMLCANWSHDGDQYRMTGSNCWNMVRNWAAYWVTSWLMIVVSPVRIGVRPWVAELLQRGGQDRGELPENGTEGLGHGRQCGSSCAPRVASTGASEANSTPTILRIG